MTEEQANEITASEATRRIRAGRLTAEELTRACLARIDARESEIGAWQCLDRDRALATARQLDQQDARGLLHGVPVAIKDIIDTETLPTELGSPIYRGRRAAWDAACVAQLRRAGAIILGKTVTTEFAFFQPGKTRNPHNIGRTPGGSSSGSAAAVADHMVPIGLGTQTAASLTRPAAYCGVFGYKGSLGSFSLSGIRPFAESLDSLGVMARSVEDLALTRAAFLGATSFVSSPWEGPPPCFGLCRTPSWPLAGANMRAVLERAAERLEAAGASVQDVVLPPEFDELVETHRTIMAFEAARNYAHEWRNHQEAVSEKFRELLEGGHAIAPERYQSAKRQQARCVALLDPIFQRYAALISPGAPDEAPLIESGTGDPVFSRMWTLLGLPSVTMQAGRSVAGLPIGIQLLGASWDDDRLLRVAGWAARFLR